MESQITELAKIFIDNNIYLHDNATVVARRIGTKLHLTQFDEGGREKYRDFRLYPGGCIRSVEINSEKLGQEIKLVASGLRGTVESAKVEMVEPAKVEVKDRQRHPKACKIQMFTREEQVWLDAMNSCLRGRNNDASAALIAISCADTMLKAFKERFE